MTNGHAEGLLQFTDERQDGQLRDPAHPLRPAKGNLVVPRQTIRELKLRPGLLLRGSPKGRSIGRIEGRRRIRNFPPALRTASGFRAASAASPARAKAIARARASARDCRPPGTKPSAWRRRRRSNPAWSTTGSSAGCAPVLAARLAGTITPVRASRGCRRRPEPASPRTSSSSCASTGRAWTA